jgi:hypothetical protein
MSSRPKGVVPHPSSDKLEMIRSGKKRKSITGFKENKNITFSKQDGKYIAIEKEKKFEEAGVTKKKKNFIMFESKLGTEKETDLHKIAGAKLRNQPTDRVQEKIVIQKKRKEYLDNYQYHETKNLKNTKPDTVIHQRWGDIIGGSFEEVTVTKTQKRGGSATKNKTTTTTTTNQSLRQNKSSANLKTRPKKEKEVSATKSMETTTKVGRRGGAGGKTSQTTTTKKETKTTSKGGERKTSTRTTTTTKGK